MVSKVGPPKIRNRPHQPPRAWRSRGPAGERTSGALTGAHAGTQGFRQVSGPPAVTHVTYGASGPGTAVSHGRQMIAPGTRGTRRRPPAPPARRAPAASDPTLPLHLYFRQNRRSRDGPVRRLSWENGPELNRFPPPPRDGPGDGRRGAGARSPGAVASSSHDVGEPETQAGEPAISRAMGRSRKSHEARDGSRAGPYGPRP